MNTENEQAHPRTHSETEALALQTTLRRTEELLKSKDNELAAKEEIIALLREKIAGIKQVSEAVDQPLPAKLRERQAEREQNKAHGPKSAWERLKEWFFNA